MANVGNWVSESCSTVGTGPLVLTGGYQGQVTFAKAFTAEPVHYSIIDGANRECGTGDFDGTTGIARTSITATYYNGVYDDTAPTPIPLSGASIVSCTYNASTFDAQAADAAAANAAMVAAEAALDSFDDRYLGAKATPPTLDNDGAALLTGAMYFDTNINLMRVYTGSAWVATGSVVEGVVFDYEYTATGGQTVFNGVYDTGAVYVYVNGILLADSDYTADTGTTVVMSVGLNAGDIVKIISLATFEVADAYTKAEVDYIVTTTATAATISDLLALDETIVKSALVVDYHSDVKGGGGRFVWDATAVKNTHNGGTIIDPDVTYPTDWTNQAQLTTWFDGSANVTTGCWIRKLEGDINPRMFGAKGDGVTDDSAAIGDAIAAVITAGGGILYFPAGKYKCLGRIGTFINVENLTLLGYGAEIQNFAGTNVQGLMQFGNAATDGNGMYSASAITVNHLNILGLKFTSSGIFNSGTNRWVDQMPISVNTAKDVLVRDCYFEDWDFAAIDFGAICKDALVDSCSFYSSRVDAGHANYGVRAFCYANYTNYQNGNGDLSPTNPDTGILKAGYTYIPDTSTTWGHEGISVTNCYFENVSHGVMVSSARHGVVANNRFVNMSTRSVSLTTYSTDYLCSNNTHSLDTTQQTSTGVSVFYSLGQGTFRHQIQGEKFSVVGATNNATGFSPIKVYSNSHDWLIADCRFDIPLWAGSGGRCINVEDNADGEVRNNHFKCPNVAHPVTFLPAYTVTAPGYQQKKIWVIGNIFESFAAGAIQILSSTSAPEPIVIKDNVVHGDPTRFVACQFTNVGQVAKLDLSGNKFLGNPVRYIDNVAANKAILLSTDVLEIKSFLSTGGGVANPSTTAVSFDFGSYSLPSCFTNGQKMYEFTTYGNRANGQVSTDFYFAITGETATTVSGDIVRNAGASFQIGQVALTVRFLPLNT